MTRQAVVFTSATALALVHALDDAFVHRGAGLGLGQHALAGLIAVAATVAAIAAFPRVRPGVRAALAFSFGALALVNGMLHVAHIGEHSAGAGDVTGALAAVAGVVLVGLAAAIPWRHRGEGSWKSRSIAAPVALLGAFFVLAAMTQLAWSATLVVCCTRTVLVLGAAANSAFIGLWAYGVPIKPVNVFGMALLIAGMFFMGK